MHACMHACAPEHACADLCVCVCVYVVCVSVCLSACLPVCLSVSVRPSVCLYACPYICMFCNALQCIVIQCNVFTGRHSTYADKKFRDDATGERNRVQVSPCARLSPTPSGISANVFLLDSHRDGHVGLGFRA